MAYYHCGGGKDFKIKELYDMILPDGVTNVDKDSVDYSYKSYGLRAEYNGLELKPDVILVKANVTSTFFQWKFMDPSDISNYVMIMVTFYSTYIRFRIGATGGNIPSTGTNLNVKFVTSDIDIDELLS